jgi:hypothetical protein
MMPLSRSIKELLALATETSPIDDEALDLLGRQLLSALLLDPETPEPVRQEVARLLRHSEPASSAADAPAPGETED